MNDTILPDIQRISQTRHPGKILSMDSFIKKDRSFWVLWLLLTFYLIWGVRLIPFHPDEASLLYQSRDFETFLSAPATLAWDPTHPDDYDQTYRLLNPPFSKYILGLARVASGFPAETVSTDWDWSLTWDENVSAGALPSADLLYAPRLLNTLLFSVSIIFIYFTAKALAGTPAGITAALLMGTNALLLLHTRRSMSEAALILGVTFSLWAILHTRSRPWLAGLAVALAVASKLSNAPLFLMGFIAFAWQSGFSPQSRKRVIFSLLKYVAAFSLTIYLLMPLLWRQPVQAGLAMFETRLEFTQGQIDTLAKYGLEDQILTSPTDRFVAALAHQYFTPPAFSDVGNYIENTAAQEAAYLNIPGTNLLRGLLGGGIMLAITILGFVWTFAFTLRKPSHPVSQPGMGSTTTRRALLIFAAGTLIVAVALIATIPTPVQRYYLPLTPFLLIWAALGLTLPFTTPRK